MFLLAHISDPHLGPLPQVRPAEILNKRFFGYLSWQRQRRKVHSPAVLAALAEDLAAQEADHLVITGDLTNIALAEEFTQVGAWLRSLGPADAVSVIPGNHDAYVAVPWETSLAHWQAFMASETEAGGAASPPAGPEDFPFLRFREPLAILGLSSAQPTPLFCAYGTLGEAQLDRLRRLLRELGEEGWFRVVLLHHPPSLEGIAWRKRLVDAAAFRRVIADEGAELVLHGHDHTFGEDRIAAAAGPVPVFGVPSASAARESKKKPLAHYQTYAIARDGTDWSVQVTAHGFDPARGGFHEVRTDRLAMSGGPESRPPEDKGSRPAGWSGPVRR